MPCESGAAPAKRSGLPPYSKIIRLCLRSMESSMIPKSCIGGHEPGRQDARPTKRFMSQ